MPNLWKACLGVMAFTQNGDQIAHAWSSRDPRYKEEETQAKLDQRRKNQTGASLCKQFHDECDASSRVRCEDCLHFNKVASGGSPISLGYPSPEQQAEEEEAAAADELKSARDALEDLLKRTLKDSNTPFKKETLKNLITLNLGDRDACLDLLGWKG